MTGTAELDSPTGTVRIWAHAGQATTGGLVSLPRTTAKSEPQPETCRTLPVLFSTMTFACIVDPAVIDLDDRTRRAASGAETWRAVVLVVARPDEGAWWLPPVHAVRSSAPPTTNHFI
jgi:hypothetical protein